MMAEDGSSPRNIIMNRLGIFKIYIKARCSQIEFCIHNKYNEKKNVTNIICATNENQNTSNEIFLSLSFSDSPLIPNSEMHCQQVIMAERNINARHEFLST